MKKIIIFCDGGLGNRLGVLVGGLIISKILQREPIICWPQNTWCGCSFESIFCVNIKNTQHNINELFSSYKNNLFLIHENQTNIALQRQVYPTEEMVNNLISELSEYIIYYHNSIPDFLDKEQILTTLAGIKINPTILDSVELFCRQENINKGVIGLHLRKTDYSSLVDENLIHELINNNVDKKFFICSDDKETEITFAKYKNVIVRPKEFYTEKLDIEKGWNGSIIDKEGRSFIFNVNRSENSVIEGFKDLLVLSRTTINMETVSSFLKFAKLYNILNYDTNNS
jgi:hypothetical protein